ncbi:hypothetical protein ACQUFE_18645, partial [Enterococcus casseliflavus]|uniref:hypothetical protein n=1 Tax=Enterococcus casseliflavus TaxID=37734 RepID=UPI003D10B210
MINAINTIKKSLKDSAVKAFGEQLDNVEPAVDQAKDSQFGDFQSNLAMTLSKQLKQQPR